MASQVIYKDDTEVDSVALDRSEDVLCSLTADGSLSFYDLNENNGMYLEILFSNGSSQSGSQCRNAHA